MVLATEDDVSADGSLPGTSVPGTSVRLEAARIAASQIGVRETARNSGPEVDAYLASVGLGPGYSWCAAFVYWCFVTGAASVRADNPCPRTAGALRMWTLAPSSQTQLPEPGDVFVIDHGHGLGHVGFVELVNADGSLTTVEGNTNASGGREGDGVYRRSRDRAAIRGYLRL